MVNPLNSINISSWFDEIEFESLKKF